jgi:oligopeptide/dipeptide ABC transporter ATP-binding protein
VDTEIGQLQGEALRRERRRFQMVFQDPYASLNPRKRAGDAILDALNLMDVGDPAGRAAQAEHLFVQTGLKAEQMQLFPHQFSGGQRQRIVLARALAAQPELVVCDEPVSALDVAIQAQMLNLMMRLQRDFGLTYLFISHDLGVVRHMCDEVAVMYLGRIVEQATRDVAVRAAAASLHPRAVVGRAEFDPTARGRGQRIRLQGDPPSPTNIPPGCRFAGRCPFAQDACRPASPSCARWPAVTSWPVTGENQLRRALRLNADLGNDSGFHGSIVVHMHYNIKCCGVPPADSTARRHDRQVSGQLLRLACVGDGSVPLNGHPD